MKIRNIIFDMDGTILNTLDDMCCSVNYMMNAAGLESLSIDKVREYVGNGVRTLVRRCLPASIDGAEFEKYFLIFSNHYDIHKNDQTAPYDGILELMQTLKELGYGMAVVSNKYDSAVKELSQTLFNGYLKSAIGAGDNVRLKPESDGVIVAMRELGANADDTVYIGDSEVDVATARNAKLPFIGVTWGFRTIEQLKSEGAKLIIDKPCELLSILEGMNE